ncbi:MAG: hypothetical protein ACRD28_10130 [Acidobacteriaceae bacterium]
MSAPESTASGLGIVALSGILTASFPLPMKFSRAWRWENTWLVYATFALLIIPDLLQSFPISGLHRLRRGFNPPAGCLPLRRYYRMA